MLYIEVSKGFYNWKDAIFAFCKHEKSQCHLEGVDAIITLLATTMHIGTHLNRQHAIEVAKNKKILLKILSSINIWLDKDYHSGVTMMIVTAILFSF